MIPVSQKIPDIIETIIFSKSFENAAIGAVDQVSITKNIYIRGQYRKNCRL